MNEHVLTLNDGRQLEIQTAGEVSPNAILFHHGTPGATLTWQDWLPEVEKQGGFAISYSRPGYGSSSRRESRTVIDNTNDMEEILNHFGVQKVVSIGWSGGGPHCLADTTLSRNVAAISIAGVGEYDAADLDFLEGMGEENHVEFGAAVLGREEIQKWMEQYSPEMATITGEQLVESLGGLIGEADKKSFTSEVAEEGAASFRQALSNGYFGWMDDDLAFVQPWGFDITAITKPVELWQGDEDFMVPHSHGQWLASKISSSRLIFAPGEGHISLGVNRKFEIIENALGYLA